MPVSHLHLETSNALSVLGRLRTPIWIFDIDNGRVVWGNADSLRIWGADSLEELTSRDMGSEMSRSIAQRLRQYQEDFVVSDAVFFENWSLYPKGRPVTLSVAHRGIVLQDGRMAMLCEGLEKQSIGNDTLRCAEALLHTTVMISLFTHDGRALYRNPAARAIVGAFDETLPQHFVDHRICASLLNQLNRDGMARTVAAVGTNSGVRWHEIMAKQCLDAVTGAPAFLISEVDVTELKNTEERAVHLASHDMLTGLYNRKHIMESSHDFLDEARRNDHEAAFLLIGMDRFKYVNDAIGYDIGDKLLVEVADRLRKCLGDRQDVLARLGGDEFMIQIAAGTVAPRAENLAYRVQEALAAPYVIADDRISITPSIGVAFFPKDGAETTSLMNHANVAMYHAKESGRNRVSYYDPSFNKDTYAKFIKSGSLHTALQNREFTIFLQPKVDVDGGKIVGAEALARWNDPTFGSVPSSVFVPVCEELGLISELGAQIFEMAAIQQRFHADAGRDLKISVNLSPGQLRDPTLPCKIEDIVARTGCSPEWMEFEITESAMPSDDMESIGILNAIKEMGFKFLIDDFGTGYSNLSHLQKYPFSGLKVDRSFINVQVEQRKLASMIILMAQAMNYRTVAEGIETEEQLNWIRQHGVDEYQGFFFSKPVSLDDFLVLIKTEEARR